MQLNLNKLYYKTNKVFIDIYSYNKIHFIIKLNENKTNKMKQ